MTRLLRPKQCTVSYGKPCPACTEDIELEKELKELELQIAKINLKRRALRTVMNRNHDGIIHKFPPEIASLVFIQYALPSACPKKDEVNSPLYLGAVCQRWRQLAWATPGLWTSLSIALRKDLFRGWINYEYVPRLITEWLDRSRLLPLTIKVNDQGRLDENEIFWRQVIVILNKHSARWQDVDFDLPARRLQRLCGSSESEENILRRLALHHPPIFAPPLPAYSTFSMKSRASPTDLTLRAVSLAYVDIIWTNLTVAVVQIIGVEECLELLRRAPLLESFTMKELIRSSPRLRPPDLKIVQRRLHSLTLSKIDLDLLAYLLDSVCFPSLREWINEQSWPCPVDSVISFTESSSSCLKILKFRMEMIRKEQVINIISRLPSLEFLELQTLVAPTELLQLMCACAQSPSFLPHLQSLEIVCVHTFPWESLRQIFGLARWRTLTVKIDIQNTIFHDFCRAFQFVQELVARGFKLRVVGDGKDLLEEYRRVYGRQQVRQDIRGSVLGWLEDLS